MNQDYIPVIIGISLVVILIPISIITLHDDSVKNDYYINGIKDHLRSESCSSLNASRSIYDPSNQNTWIKSESLIDEVYKEKCQ